MNIDAHACLTKYEPSVFQNNWKLTPIFRPIVIQVFSKTLNLCIIKTAASPAHADHPLITGHLEGIQKQLEIKRLGAWQLIE